MSQTVTLEDGAVHLFPDDASQEEIQSALSSIAPQQAVPPRTTWMKEFARELTSLPEDIQEKQSFLASRRAAVPQEEALKKAEDINRRYDAWLKIASSPEAQQRVLAQREQEMADIGVESLQMDRPAELPKLTPGEAQTLFGRGRLGRAAGAAQRAISGVAEGFLTPEGAAMVGNLPAVGGWGRLGVRPSRALGNVFMAQMAASVPVKAIEATKHYISGDVTSGDEAVIDGLVTSGLLVVPHALTRERKPSLDEVFGTENAAAIRETARRGQAGRMPTAAGVETPVYAGFTRVAEPPPEETPAPAMPVPGTRGPAPEAPAYPPPEVGRPTFVPGERGPEPEQPRYPPPRQIRLRAPTTEKGITYGQREVETPSPVPPVIGQPVDPAAESQTETGIAQRGGPSAGRQEEAPAPGEVAALPDPNYPLGKFIRAMTEKGYRYASPQSEDSVRSGGYKLPTMVSADGGVKLALDTTERYVRGGNVWIGDPTQPMQDALHLEAVVTDPAQRGKGLASKVMKDAAQSGDEAQIRLTGEPVPMRQFIKRGQQSLSRQALLDWYSRIGFKEQEGTSGMLIERRPQAAVPTEHVESDAPELIRARRQLEEQAQAGKGRSDRAYRLRSKIGQLEKEAARPAGERVARGISAGERFDRETEATAPDILDWIRDNMKLLSKTRARKTMGERWQENKSNWDDAPERLSAPHHNIIYAGEGEGGSAPDVVAQAAYDAGVLKAGAAARDLWPAIDAASKKRIKAIGTEKKQAAMMEQEAAEYEAWLKASSKGKLRVTPENLKKGDKMWVKGQEIEVTKIDPVTGDVTLKDGTQFGIQTAKPGQKFYVQKFEEASSVSAKAVPAPTEEAAVIPPPAEVAPPKAELFSREETPFNLEQERAAATPKPEAPAAPRPEPAAAPERDLFAPEPEKTALQTDRVRKAQVIQQMMQWFGLNRPAKAEAMLDNPNTKEAVKVWLQETYGLQHWRNLAQEFGGSPEESYNAAMERGVKNLDEAKRAVGVQTEVPTERPKPLIAAERQELSRLVLQDRAFRDQKKGAEPLTVAQQRRYEALMARAGQEELPIAAPVSKITPEQAATIEAVKPAEAAPAGTRVNNFVKGEDGRWRRLDEEGKPTGIPLNRKQSAQLEEEAKRPPEPPDTRPATQILNEATRVKVTVPEGATMVRVTDKQGRQSAPMSVDEVNKGVNVFEGADVAKVEAGTIDRNKKFQVVPGEVNVREVRERPIRSGIEYESEAKQIRDKETGLSSVLLPDAARVERDLAGSGEVLRGTADEIERAFSVSGRPTLQPGEPKILGKDLRRAVHPGAKEETEGVLERTRVFIETKPKTAGVSVPDRAGILAHRILFGAGDSASTQFNHRVAKKLSGLKLVFIEREDKVHAFYEPERDAVVINTKALDGYDLARRGDMDLWEAVVGEELIHAATWRLSSKTEQAAVWDSLSQEEKQQVRQAYGGWPKTKEHSGMEYIRMVIQDRLSGAVSERFDPIRIGKAARNILEKALTFLREAFGRKPANDVARRVIERIESALRGEPPIQRSAFERGSESVTAGVGGVSHEYESSRAWELDPKRVAENLQRSGKVLWRKASEIDRIFADALESSVGQRRIGKPRAVPASRSLSARATAARLEAFRKTRFFIETDSASPAIRANAEILANRILQGTRGTTQPVLQRVGGSDFVHRLSEKTGVKFVVRDTGNKFYAQRDSLPGVGDFISINSRRLGELDFRTQSASFDAVISEELLHVVTLRVATEKELTDVWNALSAKEQADTRRAYDPDNERPELTPRDLGAEHIRMILQQRLEGRVTEETVKLSPEKRTILQKVLDYLRETFGLKPASDVARQVIDRIEAAIRGEAAIKQSVAVRGGRRPSLSLSDEYPNKEIKFKEAPADETLDQLVAAAGRSLAAQFVGRIDPARVRRVEPYQSEPQYLAANAMGGPARQAIEMAFGRRVVFLDAGPGAPFNGVTFPRIPEYIFINIRSSKPHLVIVGHELLEHLAAADSSLYNEMLGKLEPFIRDSDKYAERINQWRSKLGMRPLESREVLKEIVGDFVGDSFADSSFWEKLAQREPNLFLRVAKAVMRFLNDAIQKFGGYAFVSDIAKAHDVVADTFAEFARAQGKRPTDLDPQFSLAEPPGEERTPAGEEAPKRAFHQVAGFHIGPEYDVENIQKIQGVLRSQYFDGTQPVTPQRTESAWTMKEQMLDPNQRRENAAMMERTVREQLGAETAEMAPGLFLGELMQYAKRLMAAGDPALMRSIVGDYAYIQTLSGEAGGPAAGGRGQRALREFASDPFWKGLGLLAQERARLGGRQARVGPELFEQMVREIDNLKLTPDDQQAIAEGKLPDGRTIQQIMEGAMPERQAAEEIAGQYKDIPRGTLLETVYEWLKRPTDAAEQAAFISSLVARLNELRPGLPREFLQTIAEATWNRKVTVDGAKRRRLWDNFLKNLDTENERYANSLLNRLESSQTEWIKPDRKSEASVILKDALRPLNAAERQELGGLVLGRELTPEETARRDALRQRDALPENPSAFTVPLRDQLIAVTVKPATATQLAWSVYKKRMTDSNNADLRLRERLAESPNVRSLIEALQSSPYRMQKDPAWRLRTAVDWFVSNGLSREQAQFAAKQFDKQFSKALQDAAERTARRLMEGKTDVRNVSDLVRAIRLGLMDPDKSWADDIAQRAGFKPLSREQSAALAELDLKTAMPGISAPELAQTVEQMMGIFRRSGAGPTVIKRMAEGFVNTLLSGIRTITVQMEPLIANLRDFTIGSVSDPRNTINFFTSLHRGYRNALLSEAKFAGKHDAYYYHLTQIDREHNQLKQWWERLNDDYDRTTSLKGKAWVRTRQLYAAQQYVSRLLSTIDQAMMASTVQYKLVYYGSMAFKEAGFGPKQTAELIERMAAARRVNVQDGLARGLDRNTAEVRANSMAKDVVYDFVYDVTGDQRLAAQVPRAAEFTAYSQVGRRAPGIGGMDEGLLSTPMNYLIDWLSKMRSEGGIPSILSTAAFGFVSIPWRTTHYWSHFLPYEFFRQGIHRYRTARGLDTFWKQSYATELQVRAHLREAIAGTVVLGLASAWAATHSTADDKAGKEAFGLYITGNGPNSRVLRDAWLKEGWQPYGLNFVIGGRHVAVPLTRVGEALMFPFILAAAQDDAQWKKKEMIASGRQPPNPISNYTAALIGEFFSMTGQRGIFQTVGQISQTMMGGGGISAVLKGLAKQAATVASGVVVPFKQLLASISDMFVGPMDQSSASAIVANSFPILGLPFQQKAVNRFGDQLYDRSWYGRIARTGIPIAFQVSKTPENELLYNDVLLQKAAAPPELRRFLLEERYGDLSNEQFAKFAAESGRVLKENALANADGLKNMAPEDVKKFLQKAGQDANEAAAAKLGLERIKPAVRTAGGGGRGRDEVRADVKPGRSGLPRADVADLGLVSAERGGAGALLPPIRTSGGGVGRPIRLRAPPGLARGERLGGGGLRFPSRRGIGAITRARRLVRGRLRPRTGRIRRIGASLRRPRRLRMMAA